ncbi:MAG: flagellar biosynthesis anti-sigma factor FlgM [Lachnospiraceae bacterium]|nr:flagellar biosynthesis anti-sigma factor FlgM [Lachnospiraceae bacterium]
MRIDAYNAVNQVYQTTTQSKKVTSSQKSSRDDKVEISQAGKDIAVAKKAVVEASDVREDKIQKIKEQINAGTYAVSAEDVAEKMLGSIFGELS